MKVQEPSRQRIIAWLDDEQACLSAVEWVANQPDGHGVRELLQRAPAEYLEWLTDILTDAAQDAYLAIQQPTYDAYEAIQQPAYDAYLAIQQRAYATYEAIRQPARDAYEAIQQRAHAAYVAINGTSRDAYMGALERAYDAYLAIQLPARDAYLAIQQPARDAYDAALKRKKREFWVADATIAWLIAEVNGDDMEYVPCAI